jgi:hypothetical protein
MNREMKLWGFTWIRTDTGWAAGEGPFYLEERDGQWVLRYMRHRFESEPCATMEQALQQVLGDPIVVLGHTFYPVKVNMNLYQAQSEDLPALCREDMRWDARVPESPERRYSNLGTHETPEGALEVWLAAGLAGAQHKLNEGLKELAKWRKLMRAE